MLLRRFHAIHKYSGQGFDASHKEHRSLYSRATNHDASAPGQSGKLSFKRYAGQICTAQTKLMFLSMALTHFIKSTSFTQKMQYLHVQVDWLVYISYCAVDQILTHSFATLLLSLRYAFREAKNCILSGEYMYVFNTRGTVLGAKVIFFYSSCESALRTQDTWHILIKLENIYVSCQIFKSYLTASSGINLTV